MSGLSGLKEGRKETAAKIMYWVRHRKRNSFSEWICQLCDYYWGYHIKNSFLHKGTIRLVKESYSSSECAHKHRHKKTERRPYMLLWLTLWSHDLSSNQIHLDPESWGCSTVTLLCDALHGTGGTVCSYTLYLANTHSQMHTRTTHTCAYCSAKSSFLATKQ